MGVVHSTDKIFDVLRGKEQSSITLQMLLRYLEVDYKPSSELDEILRYTIEKLLHFYTLPFIDQFGNGYLDKWDLAQFIQTNVNTNTKHYRQVFHISIGILWRVHSVVQTRVLGCLEWALESNRSVKNIYGVSYYWTAAFVHRDFLRQGGKVVVPKWATRDRETEIRQWGWQLFELSCVDIHCVWGCDFRRLWICCESLKLLGRSVRGASSQILLWWTEARWMSR